MASHSKQTPRQKMISMMYLVLTALLALNVSKEVVDGYTVVNSSVEASNSVFANKIETAYKDLERDFNMNQVEVGPFYEKAKTARKISSEMASYIENLRDELIAVTEDISIDSAKVRSIGQLRRLDDYTIPTGFLIGPREDGANGRANLLRKRIVEYRKNMLNLIQPKNRELIQIALQTEGVYYNKEGKALNWEMHHFNEIPLAADIPILNKLISEVRTAEMEILEGLNREIRADDYRYDMVAARILHKSNFLFTDEPYEAEVIVAAFDTTQIPNVYVKRGVDSLSVAQQDQAQLITGRSGNLRFRFPPSSPGKQKFAGFVSVRNNSGKENHYHFKSEYFVVEPSTTVSATKMNVLYVGVNNPVSISASGIADEDIVARINHGSIVRSKGSEWIVKVPAGVGKIKMDISSKVNGAMKTLGSQNFRVKELPDPTPYIARTKSGVMNRENLLIAGQLTARLPDDFEFDYPFEIKSFTMNLQKGFNSYRFESKSEKLTNEMKNEIKATNRGQVVVFDEIVVSEPGGGSRTLNPLILRLN